MKIVICLPETESYHSLRGGAISKWVYNASKGLDVFNIRIIGFGSTLNDSYYNETDVIRIDNVLSKVLLRIPLLRRLHVLWYARIVAANLSEVDVLHVHNQWELVNRIRCLGYTNKIVLHMHNNYLDRVNISHRNRLESDVDLFLFCSHAVFNSSRVLHGTVLYNGYDCEIFRNSKSCSKRSFTIGFAARLDENKGLHYLLNALPSLKLLYPNLRLIISGNPESPETSYQKLIIETIANLNKRFGVFIDLKGVLPHAEMQSFYNSIDLLWAVSLYREAFGMNLIEAIACGTQVVVNNIGGVEEALGTNEFGIDAFHDVETVKKVILSRIENTTYWQGLVIKSQNHISSQFKWDNIQEGYIDVLRTFMRT